MELAKFKGKQASLSLICLAAMKIKKTKSGNQRERQGTSRAWIEFLPKHQMTMFGLFPCTASSLAPSFFVSLLSFLLSMNFYFILLLLTPFWEAKSSWFGLPLSSWSGAERSYGIHLLAQEQGVDEGVQILSLHHIFNGKLYVRIRPDRSPLPIC